MNMNEKLDNEPRSLGDLLRPGSTLMVGTSSDGSMFESRPLTVAAVDADAVRMLIDRRADWAANLGDGDMVLATLSDNRENSWVSLTGTLWLSNSQEEIDELWSVPAEAFFDGGRQAPGLAILGIDVKVGAFWSTPSGHLGSLITLVKAKLTDGKDVGAHGDVAL
jgi:general stress protein 26